MGFRLRIPCLRHASRARKTRPPLPPADMTSQSGRNQILATWQEAFARLNSNQPGITGLMNFAKVCSTLLRPGITRSDVLVSFRHGSLRGSIYILSTLTTRPQKRAVRYLRSTLFHAYNSADLKLDHFPEAPHEVRAAFEALGGARRLPAIFEAFLGTALSSWLMYEDS